MHQLLRRTLTRVLSLTLAALLLAQPSLAAAGPVLPEDYRTPFSDVKEGDWFYPYVSDLNRRGMVNGYPDGRFGPRDVTRMGDSMIMILKAAGSGDLIPLPNAHYAASYAAYAVERGWLAQEEVPANLDSACPRLFIAQLAAKALGLSPVAVDEEHPSPFADTDDGYVIALFQKGVVAGNLENGQRLFKPQDSIVRAEISAIVWQIREYAGHVHFNDQVLEPAQGVAANPYRRECFVLEDGRMTYTGPGYETATGIDVSYLQDTIDWKAVAKDGIDFAVIRAGGRYYGSGELFTDSNFRLNARNAIRAGLDVGVYFFSQAISVEEARDEAAYLLELVEDYKITGPVVFDWEPITYDTARTDGVDRATLTAMADAFCREIEGAGLQPMIYFNQYTAYLRYDLSGVARYPFWLAQYDPAPTFYYDFRMWQYSQAGEVKGIEGKVDLNLLLVPVEEN